MKIVKKARERGIGRGRFFFLRALDVLHVYRQCAITRTCSLVASIEPRGSRGQIRMASYQRNPLEVCSGWEALQMLRVTRRYG